jgi:hypothetical protein
MSDAGDTHIITVTPRLATEHEPPWVQQLMRETSSSISMLNYISRLFNPSYLSYLSNKHIKRLGKITIANTLLWFYPLLAMLHQVKQLSYMRMISLD